MSTRAWSTPTYKHTHTIVDKKRRHYLVFQPKWGPNHAPHNNNNNKHNNINILDGVIDDIYYVVVVFSHVWNSPPAIVAPSAVTIVDASALNKPHDAANKANGRNRNNCVKWSSRPGLEPPSIAEQSSRGTFQEKLESLWDEGRERGVGKVRTFYTGHKNCKNCMSARTCPPVHHNNKKTTTVDMIINNDDSIRVVAKIK